MNKNECQKTVELYITIYLTIQSTRLGILTAFRYKFLRNERLLIRHSHKKNLLLATVYDTMCALCGELTEWPKVLAC